MPWDALPPHINEPHEWDGKDDDDHWYTRWRKQVKGWFAFGPRCRARWARFRNWPITLFCWSSNRIYRVENDWATQRWVKGETGWNGLCWYLSRVQYESDWHIGLEWPLFLHGHVGNWQFYIGFKRDADKVYWLALYFGRIWK